MRICEDAGASSTVWFLANPRPGRGGALAPLGQWIVVLQQRHCGACPCVGTGVFLGGYAVEGVASGCQPSTAGSTRTHLSWLGTRAPSVPATAGGAST